VICAAEHLKWYNFFGRRKLISFFRRLIPLAPSDEWLEAIAGLLIRKFDRRFTMKRRGPKIWLALNMRFRIGLYREMMSIAKCEGCKA
jgi:hypothetical protein